MLFNNYVFTLRHLNAQSHSITAVTIILAHHQQTNRWQYCSMPLKSLAFRCGSWHSFLNLLKSRFNLSPLNPTNIHCCPFSTYGPVRHLFIWKMVLRVSDYVLFVCFKQSPLIWSIEVCFPGWNVIRDKLWAVFGGMEQQCSFSLAVRNLKIFYNNLSSIITWCFVQFKVFKNTIVIWQQQYIIVKMKCGLVSSSSPQCGCSEITRQHQASFLFWLP